MLGQGEGLAARGTGTDRESLNPEGVADWGRAGPGVPGEGDGGRGEGLRAGRRTGGGGERTEAVELDAVPEPAEEVAEVADIGWSVKEDG